MELLIKISYYLHIAAGVTSLVSGPAALIFKKGSKPHIVAGWAFFWSMTIVFVSAVLNGIYKEMYFLTFVAIFSYYNVISGIRALKLRGKTKAQPVDYFIHIVALATMIGFVVFGIWAWQYQKVMAGLAIGFGLAGMGNVKTYSGMLSSSLQDIPKTEFLKWHIGGLVGGFIASLTAFSVQTMQFMPDLLQWLWPTIVFVPVISYWKKKYSGKPKVKTA